jgi:Flp pilus assembly pilin Flp
MLSLARRFLDEDSGQDLIEYAFLAVFIALAVSTSLSTVGCQLNSRFTGIGNSIGSGS